MWVGSRQCSSKGYESIGPEEVYVQVRIYFEPNNLLLNRIICRFVHPGYLIVVKVPYVTNHFFLLLLSNMIGLKFNNFAHLFVNHFKILCSHGIFSTETRRMSIN